MKNWWCRQWHSYLSAFWTMQIESARRERDWLALDEAITKRDFHEGRLADYQGT
jgi:hypothetical protein